MKACSGLSTAEQACMGCRDIQSSHGLMRGAARVDEMALNGLRQRCIKKPGTLAVVLVGTPDPRYSVSRGILDSSAASHQQTGPVPDRCPCSRIAEHSGMPRKASRGNLQMQPAVFADLLPESSCHAIGTRHETVSDRSATRFSSDARLWSCRIHQPITNP